MDKNVSPKASPATLYFCSFMAAIFAIATIYVDFVDSFLHALVLVLNFVLLFILIIVVASAFKKGQKELVKASTAAMLTSLLSFHFFVFSDLFNFVYSYLFVGNIFITLESILGILTVILFVIVYINHFKINSSNESATSLVKINKTILTIIAIICLILPVIIYYYDVTVGQTIEVHLILTYITNFFTSFIIMSVEVMINEFREAREKGVLNKVMVAKVGIKAAKTAGLSKPKKTTKKTKIK